MEFSSNLFQKKIKIIEQCIKNNYDALNNINDIIIYLQYLIYYNDQLSNDNYSNICNYVDTLFSNLSYKLMGINYNSTGIGTHGALQYHFFVNNSKLPIDKQKLYLRINISYKSKVRSFVIDIDNLIHKLLYDTYFHIKINKNENIFYKLPQFKSIIGLVFSCMIYNLTSTECIKKYFNLLLKIYYKIIFIYKNNKTFTSRNEFDKYMFNDNDVDDEFNYNINNLNHIKSIYIYTNSKMIIMPTSLIKNPITKLTMLNFFLNLCYGFAYEYFYYYMNMFHDLDIDIYSIFNKYFNCLEINNTITLYDNNSLYFDIITNVLLNYLNDKSYSINECEISKFFDGIHTPINNIMEYKKQCFNKFLNSEPLTNEELNDFINMIIINRDINDIKSLLTSKNVLMENLKNNNLNLMQKYKIRYVLREIEEQAQRITDFNVVIKNILNNKKDVLFRDVQNEYFNHDFMILNNYNYITNCDVLSPKVSSNKPYVIDREIHIVKNDEIFTNTIPEFEDYPVLISKFDLYVFNVLMRNITLYDIKLNKFLPYVGNIFNDYIYDFILDQNNKQI